MLFQGKIYSKKRGEKYRYVEVPDLDMATQGEDESECLVMIKDALESFFEEFKLEVEILPVSKSKFFVQGNNLKPLLARFLKVQREKKGLTIQEVANRLGYSSKSSYAQYEQAKSLPSIDKLSDFLRVISPGEDLILTVTKKSPSKAS